MTQAPLHHLPKTPCIRRIVMGLKNGTPIALLLWMKGIHMQPNFHDQRAVKLEKVFSSDFIPLFSGRPIRTARIGKDDSLDLKIILNTTRDVEEFLAKF
jgi:hypothetical protein